MADYGEFNPVAGSRGGAYDIGSARASYVHKDITKVNIGGGEGEVAHNGGGGWRPYGGAWWGRYMGWMWLIWVFLIPIIIFILLLVFPPQCLLYTNPSTGIQTVDLTRTLLVSIFVGWFILLIFWILCAFC
jgi:uncharacterized integral membrane protein